MKALMWAVLAATVAGTGGYVIVYLVRWEWHRALIAGVLFLAAEIALATVLLLRAVHRAGQAPAEAPTEDRLLEHIERARPTRDHFAWLRPRDGAAVFIPVLLGAGVLVSGIAFVVERLAANTAGAALERGLARDLAGIAFPAGGLVADDAELAAQDTPYADDPELRVLLAPLQRGR
jgi:hypothetical protein